MAAAMGVVGVAGGVGVVSLCVVGGMAGCGYIACRVLIGRCVVVRLVAMIQGFAPGDVLFNSTSKCRTRLAHMAHGARGEDLPRALDRAVLLPVPTTGAIR